MAHSEVQLPNSSRWNRAGVCSTQDVGRSLRTEGPKAHTQWAPGNFSLFDRHWLHIADLLQLLRTRLRTSPHTHLPSLERDSVSERGPRVSWPARPGSKMAAGTGGLGGRGVSGPGFWADHLEVGTPRGRGHSKVRPLAASSGNEEAPGSASLGSRKGCGLHSGASRTGLSTQCSGCA